ncbi:S-layer homology domain-containing protein [Paenibacillus foliorum]|uniref:S-layer homology domain-containing protein n=1 Tax=Paenibacillus foliorum TaxID=2654974 RepID=UPI001492A557|nr:S-layer homology domain-containing protein [Paenibacillus foliorum]
MNKIKKTVSLFLSALLVLQMVLIFAPLQVHAETTTELAKYGVSANAVIEQANQTLNLPSNSKGSGNGIYNIKTATDTSRLAYFKFDLPDLSKVTEANKILLSIKGKPNTASDNLEFSVIGVTYNNWFSEKTATTNGYDVTQATYSNLIAWRNAPVTLNSSGDTFQINYPGTQSVKVGSFNATGADNEYRVDVTNFVKTSGAAGAVTFMIKSESSANSQIFSDANTSNINTGGTYGVTNKKPALILQKVEGPGPNLPYTVPPTNVTASADDGNVPQNVVGNNRYYRWSAQNTADQRQWIQLDLGSVKPIGYLGIGFNAGKVRKSFFDILVSNDGIAWTPVLEGQESSGTTEEVELVNLSGKNISARYVRYLGNGNSAPNSKDWNSLTAFQIYPPASDGSTILIPVPYTEPPKHPAERNTIPGLVNADGTPYTPYEPNRNPTKTWNIVTDFGAKPDDPNFDNSVIINNAISSSNVLSGHEIYFPNGVYHLKSTMSSDALSNFQVKSGVNLRGESEQGTVLLSYFNELNGSSRVIKAFAKKELLISNFTIKSIFGDKLNEIGPDGQPKYAYSTNTNTANPKIGGYGNGIYIDQSGGIGSNKIVVENVTIENFQRMGIRVSRSQEITIRNSTFKNATDVGAGGAGYGIAVQGDTTKVDHFGEPIDVYFNLVENNKFLGPYLRHGVIVQHFAHNNLITKNYANGTLLDSLDLHGENEYLNEISYNLIENVPKEAIGVGNTGGTPPNTNHSASGPKNYIHHNTLKHNRDGVMVYMGSPDTIIEANEIIGTSDYNMYGGTSGAGGTTNVVQDGVGIKLHNAPGTIVKDNIIKGNTAANYSGILLAHHNGDSNENMLGAGAGDPENVTIIGNTVTGNTYGLKIETGKNIVVKGNTIKDNLIRNLKIDVALADSDLKEGDATLSGLKVMDGTTSLDLTPAFAADKTDYALTVAYRVQTLVINATQQVNTSTVKVNETVQSGANGVTVGLLTGQNSIAIEVTSENGTKKKYQLMVNRLGSSSGSSSNRGGGGSPSGVTTPDPGTKTNASTQLVSEIKTVDNKAVAQAKVDDKVIDTALKNTDNGKLKLAVDSSVKADQMVVSLNNSALQKIATEAKVKSVTIETKLGNYELPVKQINLQDLAAKLGVSKENVNIEVTITKNDSAADKAKSSGQRVLGAIEFTVKAVSTDGKSIEISTFTQFVPRTIKVEGTLNGRNLAAVRVETDGQGNTVYQPVPFTVSGTEVTLYSRTNSTYMLLENNITFADVKTHWAKDEIERMANKFIVQGVSKEEFQPDQAVTRAEFAALIARSMGLKPVSPSKNIFNDIRSGDWFEGQVYAAAEVGIVSGYDDQTFRPNQQISRQEMAVMIYRAMKFAGFDDSSKAGQNVVFADENLFENWAKEAISVMANKKIVEGVASGKYDPTATATRAQSSVILSRMLSVVQFTQ